MANEKKTPESKPLLTHALVSLPQSEVVDVQLMFFLVALATDESVRNRFLSDQERETVMSEFSLDETAKIALRNNDPKAIHNAAGGPGAYQYHKVRATAAARKIRVEVEIDDE